MTRAVSDTRRPKAKPAKASGGLLSGLVRRFNARVEGPVRAGVASPGLFPVGLIVLETTGRRSGKTHRTPLVATLGPCGYLWVSTVLGRKANWLRNARANPEVRYWLMGRELDGRALVSAPGYAAPDLGELPELFRWAAMRAIRLARALQFGVLIIAPDGDGRGSKC